MSIERLPISVLKDIEPEAKWPQMCNDPNIFFNEIAKRLFVKIDTNLLAENVVISGTIPQSVDRGKIWFKTSWPYAIGFLANGEYQMDYGVTGLPKNIPFLHKAFDPTPAHVKQLGDIELDQYGMKELQTKSTAKKRMYWYIFEPPAINI